MRVVLDSGGAVLDRYDHEPFGNAIAVSGAVTGVRKGYIDKEKDVESGLYNLGVRLFDAKNGMFLSTDALSECYYQQTPYQYALENPLRHSDPTGLAVDMNSFRGEIADNIMSDLSLITGLSYYLDNKGRLQYRKDKNGKAIIASGHYSPKARAFMMSVIDAKRTVITQLPQEGGPIGSCVIPTVGSMRLQLSPDEVRAWVRGTSPELNRYTEGFGMNFIHELTHTGLGPNGGVYDDYETTGGAVDFQNEVRRELGPDWGQRMQYIGIDVGKGLVYVFDKQTLLYMRSQNDVPYLKRQAPTSGKYIIVR